MIRIQRTTTAEGAPDKVEIFVVPKLGSKTVGEGVTNKLICDLKRYGSATAILWDGRRMFFKIILK